MELLKFLMTLPDEQPVHNTLGFLGTWTSVQIIWNLLLVESPWQWQSLPPAPPWKDAFDSIIISIYYSRALFKDGACLPKLQVQNYPHDLLPHDRSSRRRVGAVRRESQACLSSQRIIVWPLLFMSAAAFSSWETQRTGLDAPSACLFNGHLDFCSGFLDAHSQRKKIHFITRNKNIKETTQVARMSERRCQARVLCFLVCLGRTT